MDKQHFDQLVKGVREMKRYIQGVRAGKSVRDWLRERGFAFEANGKPKRPKEALEAALRMPDLPRSSALYQTIAEKISLRRCGDEAFIRLRNQLIEWFPK